MSYVIKAVLSNARHPEYGQVTVPFPIPNEEYGRIIELLEPLEIGDALRRDCQIDELDSFYTILNKLIGKSATLDELDYLAKRLDSFCEGEDAQFQGMAHKLGITDIKDLINLTFCCQQATVITNFSDLEKVGRDHYMNLNGGCATMEALENLDGLETALLLLDSGDGVITPYGVVYDNGMKLEQLYNGRQFPAYLYDNCLMVLEITPMKGPGKVQNPEYLYLPAPARQVERTLLRAGIQGEGGIGEVRMKYDLDNLPEQISAVLNIENEDPHTLNALSYAIRDLDEAEIKKLGAAILLAKPQDASEIRHLAENLELFEFFPGVHNPKEYGQYMIRQSERFEYDENLDEYYDFEGYGRHRMSEEEGAFLPIGYVAYRGDCSIQEILECVPQSQTDLQMGGI